MSTSNCIVTRTFRGTPLFLVSADNGFVWSADRSKAALMESPAALATAKRASDWDKTRPRALALDPKGHVLAGNPDAIVSTQFACVGTVVEPLRPNQDFQVPAEVLEIRRAGYTSSGHAFEYKVLNGAGTPDAPRENVSCRWYHGSAIRIATDVKKILRIVDGALMWVAA